MKILVTDKNRHVRALLARELRAENCTIVCSRQAEDICNLLRSKNPPDIAIIDPEVFGEEPQAILSDILGVQSRTYCIIHVFNDFHINASAVKNMRKVIKSENSIEELRSLIKRLAYGTDENGYALNR